MPPTPTPTVVPPPQIAAPVVMPPVIDEEAARRAAEEAERARKKRSCARPGSAQTCWSSINPSGAKVLLPLLARHLRKMPVPVPTMTRTAGSCSQSVLRTSRR
ncbi:hypothetical protein ACOJBM_06345 [Rhizobium beringeri]